MYGLLGYEPLTYEGYVYPAWANVLGWIIAGSSVAMIPAVALYQYFNTSGTPLQVIHFVLYDWFHEQSIVDLFLETTIHNDNNYNNNNGFAEIENVDYTLAGRT